MILKLILAVAAIFALFWTIKNKKLFPAIITLGMIVGIALVISSSEPIQMVGLYVYLGFTVLALIYGLTIKEKKVAEQITISLIAASILIYWLWALNHWPGPLSLAPIFVLLLALGAVVKKLNLRDELGFMVILVFDAIAILLEHWMKAN